MVILEQVTLKVLNVLLRSLLKKLLRKIHDLVMGYTRLEVNHDNAPDYSMAVGFAKMIE